MERNPFTIRQSTKGGHYGCGNTASRTISELPFFVSPRAAPGASHIAKPSPPAFVHVHGVRAITFTHPPICNRRAYDAGL